MHLLKGDSQELRRATSKEADVATTPAPRVNKVAKRMTVLSVRLG